ncbi:FAD/NAD(P)-binding domain-containing protein [Cadophora sp. DSE1049]|nr:FAD/NAD(P)-binding domain-containing protein [Cadophora sp. DSE1049]
MPSNDNIETTEVLIVGCGPTGALLSALLGRFGIKNIVLEKEPDITNDPRGITLDEDGLRFLQEVGLYDKIYTEIGSSIGMLQFITSGNDLRQRPFLKFNMDTTEGGTGHVGVMSHRQPIMEKHLRLAASRYSCCELRSSCTVTHIEEDDENVYCHYENSSRSRKTIRSKFLVGCDGKRGYTRKMYLEPKGVIMEQASAFGYNETWVALNLRITPPTPETHPDLPFWNLGYTPEDVYDLYFPKSFRFICNDKRPSVCGRFGNGAERLWRYEFVVKREEDPMVMASEKETTKIIKPYLTHDGSKYGCDHPIPFPYDCIETLRSRPFAFSARSCNKWAVGRVILAGDSAHVFPPFGGQGISSGFRDSSGLAWRLALAIRENTKNHEQLLSGWYRERQQQLKVSLSKTIHNGKLCTEGNTWKFTLTKILIRFMQLIPSLNRKLEAGPRGEGMIRYRPLDGLPFLGEFHGGISLPQVYCAPLMSCSKHLKVQFTDDVIFAKCKKGMFQILVLLKSFSDLILFDSALKGIDGLSGGLLFEKEATFLLQDSAVRAAVTMVGDNFYRLATGEEFAADENLCKGRPVPQLYDMHRIGRDLGGLTFIIVRPDRFVYAACRTAEELHSICGGIREKLGLD